MIMLRNALSALVTAFPDFLAGELNRNAAMPPRAVLISAVDHLEI
jgi:hypothetical protein